MEGLTDGAAQSGERTFCLRLFCRPYKNVETITHMASAGVVPVIVQDDDAAATSEIPTLQSWRNNMLALWQEELSSSSGKCGFTTRKRHRLQVCPRAVCPPVPLHTGNGDIHCPHSGLSDLCQTLPRKTNSSRWSMERKHRPQLWYGGPLAKSNLRTPRLDAIPALESLHQEP